MWHIEGIYLCSMYGIPHLKTVHACAADIDQGETESDPLVYDYDQDYVDRKYELLSLKVIHRRRRTGFEETKDFPVRVNDLVAGRYQVEPLLTVQQHWERFASVLHGC